MNQVHFSLNNMLLLALPVLAQEIPPPHSYQIWEDSTGQQIIAPPALAKEVGRTFQWYQQYLPQHAKSHQLNPIKYPTVLYNDGMVLSASVDPLNYSSQWSMSPPFVVSNLEWLQALALHEGYHMAQMEGVHQNGLWRYLMGRNTGFLSILFYPQWSIEGDAVWTETALSRGGRGRLAAFLLPWKNAFFAEKKPDYWQSMFGSSSLRSFGSDPYPLGYMIHSYMNRKYGDAISAAVDLGTLNLEWDPTFSGALKRLTGQNAEQTYTLAQDAWLAQWNRQFQSLDSLPAHKTLSAIPVMNSNYWHAEFPVGSNSRGVWSVLAGPRTLSYLVCRDSTQKIVQKYRLPNSALSTELGGNSGLKLKGDQLFWLEKIPHPRWSMVAMSRLAQMDLVTGKLSNSKFDPNAEVMDLDPSATWIAEYHQKEPLSNHLLIRDFKSQVITDTIPLSDFEGITEINWGDRGVFVLSQNRQGNRVWSYNPQTKEKVDLIPYTTTENIMHLSSRDSLLVFSSDTTGIASVHLLNLNNKQRFLVAQEKIGLTNPIVTEKEVLMSKWESGANRLVAQDLDSPALLALDKVKSQKIGPWLDSSNRNQALVDSYYRQMEQFDDPYQFSKRLNSKPYIGLLYLRPISWLVSMENTDSKGQELSNLWGASVKWTDPLQSHEINTKIMTQDVDGEQVGQFGLQWQMNHFWLQPVLGFDVGKVGVYSISKSDYGLSTAQIYKPKLGLNLPLKFTGSGFWDTQIQFSGMQNLEMIRGASPRGYYQDGETWVQELSAGIRSAKSGLYGQVPERSYGYQYLFANHWGVKNGQEHTHELSLTQTLNFLDELSLNAVYFDQGQNTTLDFNSATTPVGQSAVRSPYSAGFSFAYQTAPIRLDLKFPWILRRAVYLKDLTFKGVASKEYGWNVNPLRNGGNPELSRQSYALQAQPGFHFFSHNMLYLKSSLGVAYDLEQFKFVNSLGLEGAF